MAIHLVCVQPFHLNGRNFAKGERVDDQNEINALSLSHDGHFVRVAPLADWVDPNAEVEQAPAEYTPTPAP